MNSPSDPNDARVASATDPLQELSSELVTCAARLVRNIRRRHDVPAGVRIMSILAERGPLGVSALAEADHCSQPTMSNAVAALVAAGRVDKVAHPVDARSSVISMTALGRSDLARFRSDFGAAVAARISASTSTVDDLAVAVAVLRDAAADVEAARPIAPLTPGPDAGRA